MNFAYTETKSTHIFRCPIIGFTVAITDEGFQCEQSVQNRIWVLMHKPHNSRLVAVGTHHKTGTIWLKRVFMEITRTLNISRYQIRKPRSETKIPPSDRSVLVSWHSTFSDELKSRSDLRGIHMIRDPRDVLISGARYHLNAPKWREAWLYQPNRKLGGKTYHACLNECNDWPSQLFFEMDHMHLETLNQMTGWDYNLPNWRELRYEEMINDTDMAIFSDAADFLGFKGEEKEVVMTAYWNNSLFGALSKDGIGRHIKSGAPDQWRSKLPRVVAETYAELFGEQLKALGYAEDDGWVDECKGPTN